MNLEMSGSASMPAGEQGLFRIKDGAVKLASRDHGGGEGCLLPINGVTCRRDQSRSRQ